MSFQRHQYRLLTPRALPITFLDSNGPNRIQKGLSGFLSYFDGFFGEIDPRGRDEGENGIGNGQLEERVCRPAAVNGAW